MKKNGFEHLRFSSNTNKQRRNLLIISCLGILVFEYNVSNDLVIYNISIPIALLKIGLTISAIWTTILFVFYSIDDFIEWKKLFLLDDKIRPSAFDKRTILIEIESFSKGEIKYKPIFGTAYGGAIPEVPDLEEVKKGLDSDMKQFEKLFKKDIKSIEQFKSWYKFCSYLTIFRFGFIEFTLPLIIVLYSIIICRFLPILPK